MEYNIGELADGNFNGIVQQLLQESKNIKSLSLFFLTTKKELDRFGKSIQKAISSFKQTYHRSSETTPWDQTIIKSIQALDETTKFIENTVQLLELKVLEPFDIYIGHYTQNSKGYLHECTNIVETLSTYRAKIKRIADKIAKNVIDHKVEEKLYQEHKEQVTLLNNFINENEQIYKSKINFIIQNEDNRIDFERKTFVKYMNSFEELAKIFLKQKSIIDTNFSAKKLSEQCRPLDKLTFSLFEKAEHIEMKKRKFSDDTFSSAGVSVSNISSVETVLSDMEGEAAVSVELPSGEVKFLQSAFYKLLKGENTDSKGKQRLMGITQYSDGRIKITNLLLGVTQRISLPLEAFETLGEMINKLLETIVIYNDSRAKQLNAVLSFCSLISTTEASRGQLRYCLREVIWDNQIWRSKERWQEIIHNNIDNALAAVEKRKKTLNKEPCKGFIKKFFSVKEKLLSKKQAEEINPEKESAEKLEVIYSELLNIAVGLSLMNVDHEMGRGILMHFALIYNLDQEKLLQLILEYESSRSSKREEGKQEEIGKAIELAKREACNKKYGSSKLTKVIGMTLKFIDDETMLRNILLVNKNCHEIFRIHIYKLGLKSFAKYKRYDIWASILTTRGLDKLYLQLKSESLEDFKKTHTYIDSLIRLDVGRSFHLYHEEEKEVYLLFKY